MQNRKINRFNRHKSHTHDMLLAQYNCRYVFIGLYLQYALNLLLLYTNTNSNWTYASIFI